MRRHIARHYLEMVVAMGAGMLVLGAARARLLALADVEDPTARDPALAALVMALDMSVGMVAWMRYRGHAWAGTLEMVGAMFGPAVILAPLSWLGVISGDQLMTITHVAMLPIMLAVMVRRRGEYAAR